jgi:hypothetical protein
MDVMLSEPDLEVRALWAAFREELAELTTASLELTITHAGTRLTRALCTYELSRRIDSGRLDQSSRQPSTAQAAAIRT